MTKRRRDQPLTKAIRETIGTRPNPDLLRRRPAPPPAAVRHGKNLNLGHEALVVHSFSLYPTSAPRIRRPSTGALRPSRTTNVLLMGKLDFPALAKANAIYVLPLERSAMTDAKAAVRSGSSGAAISLARQSKVD